MITYTLAREVRKALGDKRLCSYSLDFEESPNCITIFGKVDTLASLQKLNRVIDSFSVKVKVKISVMEENISKDRSIGIVKSSVCDMKSSPNFRSLNVHQLIFAEGVKVLDSDGDYIFAKDLRTGFEGWVKKSCLLFTSFKKYGEWLKSGETRIVKDRFALLKGNETLYIPFGSRFPTVRKENKSFCILPNGDMFKIELERCKSVSTVSKEEIHEVWKLFLGTPYLWGGTSTYGTDCSGFVGRMYDYIGVELPRDSDQQAEITSNVKVEEAQFGDLIFFPGHVGMYIENGKMVHANLHHHCVGISSVFVPSTPYEKWLNEHISKIGRVSKSRRG